MKIGCHVGNSGPLMLEGSIKEALNYGATCFMVYLGPPQNTIRKPIESMNADKMALIAKENNISLEDVIIHAPYIVNLARKDPEKFDFAVRFIATEVSGVHNIGCKYLVLHPGSAVDSERSDALNQVAKGINEIIKLTPNARTVIAIETMAGKGNEVGKIFEELSSIIDLVKFKNKIGRTNIRLPTFLHICQVRKLKRRLRIAFRTLSRARTGSWRKNTPLTPSSKEDAF